MGASQVATGFVLFWVNRSEERKLREDLISVDILYASLVNTIDDTDGSLVVDRQEQSCQLHRLVGDILESYLLDQLVDIFLQHSTVVSRQSIGLSSNYQETFQTLLGKIDGLRQGQCLSMLADGKKCGNLMIPQFVALNFTRCSLVEREAELVGQVFRR